MKKIWLTSLVSSEEEVKTIMAQLKTYGLEAGGHFWEDDLEKVSWIKAGDAVADEQNALWAIIGSDQELRNPSLRYGLALLTITVQAKRGLDFPIIILQNGGEPILPDSLPTPMRGVEILSASGTAWGAKFVAKAHSPSGKTISPDYRLDLYGNEQIGQWFEVGPREGCWPGGMFAVTGAEIVFHGVGPKGKLPDKAVLNYPLEGMKLNLGEQEYIAWAVQNELDSGSSYFVKVKGFPETILFGPYSSAEDADVFVVELK